MRIKNPAGSLSTAPFAITISATPAAPILTAVRQTSCGAAVTNVAPSMAFSVEAGGVDTTNTIFRWTPLSAVGPVQSHGGMFAVGSPAGAVCVEAMAPAGLTPGTWQLQIQTFVSAVSSAFSNGIVVTVP